MDGILCKIIGWQTIFLPLFFHKCKLTDLSTILPCIYLVNVPHHCVWHSMFQSCLWFSSISGIYARESGLKCWSWTRVRSKERSSLTKDLKKLIISTKDVIVCNLGEKSGDRIQMNFVTGKVERKNKKFNEIS